MRPTGRRCSRARLQELFGWTETPRVARERVRILLHVLGPNHRPVQVTDDLRSFWTNAYFQVRKDLRGRYPKHAWPDDPLDGDGGGGSAAELSLPLLVFRRFGPAIRGI